jgi:hypothetical protein
MGLPGIGALLGGGGGITDILGNSQQQALEQQAQITAMTIEFQSQQEALRAVAESANAKHEANMQSLEDVGNAAR